MKKNKNFKESFFKTINNGIWFFLIGMFIESIILRQYMTYVAGIMILSISFIFFPWLKKILNIFNINIALKQKIIIFILSFLSAIIVINLNNVGYINLIIEFILVAVIWFLVIFISNRQKLKKGSN